MEERVDESAATASSERLLLCLLYQRQYRNHIVILPLFDRILKNLKVTAAHQAEAPLGWEASPLQGYPQN